MIRIAIILTTAIIQYFEVLFILIELSIIILTLSPYKIGERVSMIKIMASMGIQIYADSIMFPRIL